MKKYKYIFSLLALFVVSSCSLDTIPGGDMVTEDQRDETSAKDPEKIVVLTKGILANYIKYNVLEESSAYHSDYGYAALCQFLEMSGQDFLAPDMGYNWFRSTMNFRDRTLNSSTSEMMWRLYYNVISSSNDVIKAITPLLGKVVDADDKALFELYLGQGYVNRAFSYFQLVQTYQFTYVGNESKPSVPLILTEGDERAVPGRAAVDKVYEVIIADLNKGLELLKGKKITDKGYASEQVANGLLARVYLVMNKWTEAATAAKLAQDGYTPYSIDEVKVPAFNSSASNAWMWANVISEDNRVVTSGIINWPSHLCSFSGNSYTGVGAYRSINVNLWNKIDEADVRKHGWWVDKDLKSPFTDDLPKIKDVPYTTAKKFLEFTNIKFGAYNDVVGNPTNASDWPMMRVEEMYLIEAEALAMAGNLEAGKTALAAFLNTYRYEGQSYKSTATSIEDFQNEVWLQRRVELWGEGFAYFDLKRLKKPVQRIENGQTNYPLNARFNVAADAPNILWLIPQKEIEANPNISQADNNEIGQTPEAQVIADK